MEKGNITDCTQIKALTPFYKGVTPEGQNVVLMEVNAAKATMDYRYGVGIRQGFVVGLATAAFLGLVGWAVYKVTEDKDDEKK